MKPMTLSEFRKLCLCGKSLGNIASRNRIAAALQRAKVLEEALCRHRHTEECRQAAIAETSWRGHPACTTKCTESWQAALGGTNDADADD